MISMILRFMAKGDPPPLDVSKAAYINDGTVTVFCLDGGMTNGRPSVVFAMTLPEGGTVLFETSARLFVATANMIEAHYPELLT